MYDLAVPMKATSMPDMAQVGLKAHNLIRLARQNLPVSKGFVLTVHFFRHWLDQILFLQEWNRVMLSTSAELRMACGCAKARAMTFEFSVEQKDALETALLNLPGANGKGVFTVRSSFPDQNLDQLCLADSYDTMTGVSLDAIEFAVRRCFVTCLDERVIRCMRQRFSEEFRLQIAVFVQQQPRAELMGNAFSVNLQTYNQDQAVVHVTHSLDQSIGSEGSMPDVFVVDKMRHTILEARSSAREKRDRLFIDRGAYQKKTETPAQVYLTGSQVLALANLAVQAETEFQIPMGINWALAEEKYYLLQVYPAKAFYQFPDGDRIPLLGNRFSTPAVG